MGKPPNTIAGWQRAALMLLGGLAAAGQPSLQTPQTNATIYDHEEHAPDRSTVRQDEVNGHVAPAQRRLRQQDRDLNAFNKALIGKPLPPAASQPAARQ